MYNRILSIFALSGIWMMTGCENKLHEKASLSVTVESEGSYIQNDAIVVKAGVPVTFFFSGNPDFITYYSGEAGHEYKHINRTELSADDIDSELTFTAYAQYGSPEGTMQVYLATSFEGLLKNDYLKDIEQVNNYEGWINITEQCNLPVKASGSSDVSIVLNDYLGEKLRIAFHYYTTDNSKTQSRWEIKDLKVTSTLKKDGSQTSLSAASLNFAALDMYATNETDAYKTVNNNTEGVWNLADISSSSNPRMFIHSSAAGKPLNNDWLISADFRLNACEPDVGVGIKTVTQKVDSYTHTYTLEGDYEVTFIGTNANMEKESQVIKKIKLKVEP